MFKRWDSTSNHQYFICYLGIIIKSICIGIKDMGQTDKTETWTTVLPGGGGGVGSLGGGSGVGDSCK